MEKGALPDRWSNVTRCILFCKIDADLHSPCGRLHPITHHLAARTIHCTHCRESLLSASVPLAFLLGCGSRVSFAALVHTTSRFQKFTPPREPCSRLLRSARVHAPRDAADRPRPRSVHPHTRTIFGMAPLRLDALPPDVLEGVLAASHDLQTLRSSRAVCQAFASACRCCLPQWISRSSSNLAEMRCAVWAESPPSARTIVVESGLVSVTIVALDGSSVVCVSGADSQKLQLWSLSDGTSSSLRLPSPARSIALRAGRVATGLANGCVHCSTCVPGRAHQPSSSSRTAASACSLMFAGLCPPAHGGHDVSALCWAAPGLLVSGGLDRALRVWRLDGIEPTSSMADGSLALGGSGRGGGEAAVPSIHKAAEYLLAHRRPVTALEAVPVWIGATAGSAHAPSSRPTGCADDAAGGRVAVGSAVGSEAAQGGGANTLATSSLAEARFLSASHDGAVHIWSLDAEGVPSLSATLQLGESVWGIAIDPLGHVACACASGLQLWDLTRHRRLGRPLAHSAVAPNQSATGAAAAAAGSERVLLASGGAGLLLAASHGRGVGQREVCVYDTRIPRKPARLARWTQMASVKCAVGSNGVLVCGGSDGKLHIWSLPRVLCDAVPAHAPHLGGL